MKYIYFLIKIIRLVLNFPFTILIKFGNIYFRILRLFDPRNHDNFWPEEIDRNLKNFKSKKILISKKIIYQFNFTRLQKLQDIELKLFFRKNQKRYNG